MIEGLEKKKEVADKIVELFFFLKERLPEGRYKALAITELEKMEFWSIKSFDAASRDAVANAGTN